MHIAIVHDALFEFGGAERVLQSLLHVFPSAHVYALYADTQVIANHFHEVPKERIHTTFLQHSLLRYHTTLIQMMAPLLWRTFSIPKYDAYIVNCSYLMTNFVSTPKEKTFYYIHSPPKNFVRLEPPTRLQRIFPITPFIQHLYYASLLDKPHLFVNSRHIQTIMRSLCRINPQVLYPPIKPFAENRIKTKKQKRTYFICVSRLDRTKSIELAIHACNFLSVPLKIIGVTNEPRYEHYLRSIAGPTIEFLGKKSDMEINSLYQGAIAFLFTSINEDFGIAPLEAIAHGIPVISYYGGGVTETITQGKNGIFFTTHTWQSLVRAMQSLHTFHFTKESVKQSISQFHEYAFKKKIMKIMTEISSGI